MKIKTGLKTDNVVLFPGFVSDGGVIHCGGRKYYTVPSFTGFMHSLPDKNFRRCDKWLVRRYDYHVARRHDERQGGGSAA